MQNLHLMTTPLIQSDDYDPDFFQSEDVPDEVNQENFPQVINFMGVYTEQRPNKTGGSSNVCLHQLRLVFFCSCEKYKKELEKVLKDGLHLKNVF